MLSSLASSFLYRARTLWLFTRSDHKTFVFPETTFGVLSALSGKPLSSNTPDLVAVLRRVPAVLLWTWLNTFVFVLANQRLPQSIQEDLLNKPWRPLAAGRITEEQTRRLLTTSIPATLAIVFFFLGATEETLMIFCGSWVYNDLGGADESFIIRNFMIGLSFSVWCSGALRVASASRDITPTAYLWLTIVGVVVFTTIQVQDLKDQAGDCVRRRRTAPLVLGDVAARWGVAVPVLAWSLLCPMFWNVGVFGYLIPIGYGIVIATRVLVIRHRAGDRTTWRLWSYWLVLLYSLPLLKKYPVFAWGIYWV